MITNLLENASLRANELINFVANAAQDGAEFMGDQIPLYVQEILAWEFASSVAHFVMALIPFLICLWCIKKTYIWCKKEIDGSGNALPFFIFMLSAAVAVILFFVGLVPSAQQAIKVRVAPRVFLVEKAQEVIHGGKACGFCGKVHH